MYSTLEERSFFFLEREDSPVFFFLLLLKIIKHDEQILKRDVFITAVLQLKRKHCALIASFQQQDVFLLSITNILYLYSV